MQQFRPLPRFDLLEDAEAVEMPLAPTTDPVPAVTDPQRPVATSSQFVRFPASPTGTNPRLDALTGQSPAIKPLQSGSKQELPTRGPWPPSTNPELQALAQKPATQTAGRIPIVVLSGSTTTSTTDQLTALMGKTPATGKQPTLTAALQATMNARAGATGATGRLVVIPGARSRKVKGKASATQRHLNLRLRQGIIFLVTAIVLVCTLTTLVPLSDSQGGGNLFANIGGWIRSAQLDWDIQAQQAQNNQSNIPTALNGPGLPYMPIANSPYVAVAERAAQNAGIPVVYFVRQIQQESGFNPNAVSVTNAEGIAQFEPYTASGLGINPWDPNSALPGAARLMGNYYHQYGNYAKALGAYNAGPGAVQSAVYSCGMYWLNCMPAQSQDYVYRIMGV